MSNPTDKYRFPARKYPPSNKPVVFENLAISKQSTGSPQIHPMGVFLDVVDSPITKILSPQIVSQSIRSSLRSRGHHGRVEIHLYAYENTFSKKVIDLYMNLGIIITIVAKGNKNSIVCKMLLDILSWSIFNPEESNLLVVSQTLKEEKAVINSLEDLSSMGYSVFVAAPSSGWWPPSKCSKWIWESPPPDGVNSRNDKARGQEKGLI